MFRSNKVHVATCNDNEALLVIETWLNRVIFQFPDTTLWSTKERQLLQCWPYCHHPCAKSFSQALSLASVLSLISFSVDRRAIFSVVHKRLSSAASEGKRVKWWKICLVCPESEWQHMYQQLRLLYLQEVRESIYLPKQLGRQCDTYLDTPPSIPRESGGDAHRWTLDDFVFHKRLGEGGFGVVFHCQYLHTQSHYAMKIQSKHRLITSCTIVPGTLPHPLHTHRELLHLLALPPHPRVIALQGAFHEGPWTMLLFPLCHVFGDLQRLLSIVYCAQNPCQGRPHRIPLPIVQFLAVEIQEALCHIHAHGFVFHDLKPANVLLRDDGHVLLADLGSMEGASSALSCSRV